MKYIAICTLSCGGILFAEAAGAADIYSPVATEAKTIETQSGWTFSIAPYFWAAGLSGKTSQFGLPVVDIDSSFSDIWDNLDFAVMAIGEARYDRYSLFGDIIYTKLSVGSGTPRGILADDVDVTSETFAGLIGAGYSILQDDRSHLEAVAGARVWSVGTDIAFTGGILDGRSASDSATWVDGMVGVRGRYSFMENLYLAGWGMVGAGEADLDWDVAAALGYQFNDTISVITGYRALGVDYDEDGFIFDAVQQGPIMGLVIHF